MQALSQSLDLLGGNNFARSSDQSLEQILAGNKTASKAADAGAAVGSMPTGFHQSNTLPNSKYNPNQVIYSSERCQSAAIMPQQLKSSAVQ